MKTNTLRKLFLEYFEKHGHTIVPSSPLVPLNDPTLLFTNAGMVQFKETFLGLEKRPYLRATSCQRCVRAGGKHNDLENVGYTARHHTFFEMLGNFSFGDYFKHEAIQYAWDFVTNVLKIPEERLWITVYEEDNESENIWLNDIKINKNRFSRCGEKDNFWSMGDTGPCGPCTEIFYDHGPSIPGGPPGTPEEDGDRYIEIWNLVFMQYNRSEDGTLTPLPKPSVDTGAGLERMAAVLQGVHSNYDIDLFQHLIQAAMKITHTKDKENKSLRVIADHIRSCAFLAAEGIVPSNEGRGYVLRRITRRAIRHGVLLGTQEPFFYKLVKPLTEVMGEAYPILQEKMHEIERILKQEEIQFAKTLEQGLKILEQDLIFMKEQAEKEGTSGKPNRSSKIGKAEENIIPGETIFKLYDTYGFPVDLTADIARERGLSMDMDGFNEAMAEQRTRAREASQFTAQYSDHVDIEHATDFTGYEHLEETAKVLAIYVRGKEVSELAQGEEGSIVLESTPFYAEGGGQVGDQGVLTANTSRFLVKNTRKSAKAHLHYGVMKQGSLKLGESVLARVDREKRIKTALNHSATHLLHAALRKILGPHVQQKGSLVEPERLRFDFVQYEPLTKQQIRAVEHLVNEQIRLNTAVKTDIMSVEEALKTGAMALFGEKYESHVRVLRMGATEKTDFSVELCGGTHVSRTGDIGFFKITTESGIAAGIRRLEAVTGDAAIKLVDNLDTTLDTIATQLKCSRENAIDKLNLLVNKNKQLEKDLTNAQKRLIQGQSSETSLSDNIKEIASKMGSVKILTKEIPVTEAKTLREMVDQYKNKLHTAVIVLAGIEDSKIVLIAGVTKDIMKQISAGELVNFVARQVGGQGGGRNDMAQGGGNNPEKLTEALDAVETWVKQKCEETSLG